MNAFEEIVGWGGVGETRPPPPPPRHPHQADVGGVVVVVGVPESFTCARTYSKNMKNIGGGRRGGGGGLA